MERKKVLVIGNMNNNGFPLVRYLRGRGYDAHLRCLKNEPEHFGPDNDTFIEDYTPYVKKISWSNLPSDYMATSAKDIRATIEGFGFIIASGAAPAYLNKVNRSADIYVPYGSDLYHLPLIIDKRNLKKRIKSFLLAKSQKKGIERARHLFMQYSNEEFEGVLDKFDLKGERVATNLPFIYAPEFNKENLDNISKHSEQFGFFNNARSNTDFMVFYHSRHAWKVDKSSIQYKGTEQIIKAFARLVKEVNANAKLVMFKYGADADASVALVKELGIEPNVVWCPRMSRKEIMLGLSLSDVSVAEIGHPWVTYGAVVEAKAMGVPLIMNRNDVELKKLYKEVFPVQQASNEEEVYRALVHYYKNPDLAKKDGESCRKWFDKYVVEEPLKVYMEKIDNG